MEGGDCRGGGGGPMRRDHQGGGEWGDSRGAMVGGDKGTERLALHLPRCRQACLSHVPVLPKPTPGLPVHALLVKAHALRRW